MLSSLVINKWKGSKVFVLRLWMDCTILFLILRFCKVFLRWGISSFDLHMLENGFFVCKLYSEEDLQRVLEGFWTIRGHPMILRRWSPDVRLELDSLVVYSIMGILSRSSSTSLESTFYCKVMQHSGTATLHRQSNSYSDEISICTSMCTGFFWRRSSKWGFLSWSWREHSEGTCLIFLEATTMSALLIFWSCKWSLSANSEIDH